MGIEQFIDNEVKGNDVVLFMKGTPQFPMCGFSAQVVQILDHLGVTYKGVNVLESDDLRQGIKDYSNWPTIPQLYVKGEFVGGCDIVREMFQAGELQQLLKEKGVRPERGHPGVTAPPGTYRGRRAVVAPMNNPVVDAKNVSVDAKVDGCAASSPRLRGERASKAPTVASARVELDHQVRFHLHRVGHVGDLRDARELRGHLLVVDLDVVRHVALAQAGRFEHQGELLGLLLHLDLFVDLEPVARNGDAPAVHLTWPWLMNWRAANTVGTNLAR